MEKYRGRVHLVLYKTGILKSNIYIWFHASLHLRLCFTAQLVPLSTYNLLFMEEIRLNTLHWFFLSTYVIGNNISNIPIPSKLSLALSIWFAKLRNYLWKEVLYRHLPFLYFSVKWFGICVMLITSLGSSL